jgi:hypothetical protein
MFLVLGVVHPKHPTGGPSTIQRDFPVHPANKSVLETKKSDKNICQGIFMDGNNQVDVYILGR